MSRICRTDNVGNVKMELVTMYELFWNVIKEPTNVDGPATEFTPPLPHNILRADVEVRIRARNCSSGGDRGG